MKRIAIALSFLLLLPVMVWAGYNQTNPKNHVHQIHDPNNKFVQFEPLLRIGWRGSDPDLDQVKYEIKNLSDVYSITIKNVRVLAKDGSTAWSASPNQTIGKKSTGKKEWRGDDMVKKKIKRDNAKLEFDIDCGGKMWRLYWNPAVSGGASTSVGAI